MRLNSSACLILNAPILKITIKTLWLLIVFFSVGSMFFAAPKEKSVKESPKNSAPKKIERTATNDPSFLDENQQEEIKTKLKDKGQSIISKWIQAWWVSMLNSNEATNKAYKSYLKAQKIKRDALKTQKRISQAHKISQIVKKEIETAKDRSLSSPEKQAQQEKLGW